MIGASVLALTAAPFVDAGPAHAARYSAESNECTNKAVSAHYKDPGIALLHLCIGPDVGQSTRGAIINDSNTVWWFERVSPTTKHAREYELESGGEDDADVAFNEQFHDFADSQGHDYQLLLPGEVLDLDYVRYTRPHADAALTAAYTVQRVAEERMSQMPGEEQLERAFTDGSASRKVLWSCSTTALDTAESIVDGAAKAKLPPMYKLINASFDAEGCVSDWGAWRAEEREAKQILVPFAAEIPVVEAHPPVSDGLIAELKAGLSQLLKFCLKSCEK